MPSVKSYQNRKAEISALNKQLAELEFQRNKYRQLALTAQYEKSMAEENVKVLRHMVNQLMQREIELKMRSRILENYVRRVYTNPSALAFPPMPEEIPTCLKPLDAIKYSAERMNNGPDYLPQQLS